MSFHSKLNFLPCATPWKLILGLVVAVFACTTAFAALTSEGQYVVNSLVLMVWGALVMWMCAGFTLLEAGSVRTKNASMICMKNIGLYSIAGIMYFVIGYNLMYVGVEESSFIGTFALFSASTSAENQLLGMDSPVASEQILSKGNASMAFWFFQMVFVATTASIISGCLAERVRLWAFFLFIAVLTGFIYPIIGSWTWGGGWLANLGFYDFAGSTIVHSVGGWAALAGVLLVGARLGKFKSDGTVQPTPPSNVPIVTLGVFILWLGWFGFNGGSVLALASAKDAILMSTVLVNTNLAAGAGVILAITISRPVLGRVDLLAVLNGAIGGLVAITAGPDTTNHIAAILIGGAGGCIVVLGMKFLEIVKVDDVVGAVPAHLFAGVWGTIAVSFTNPDVSFVNQIIGVVSIGAFVFVVSLLVWWLINLVITLRVTELVEQLGQDVAELGIEAYPEFVLMPDQNIMPDDSSDYKS